MLELGQSRNTLALAKDFEGKSPSIQLTLWSSTSHANVGTITAIDHFGFSGMNRGRLKSVLTGNPRHTLAREPEEYELCTEE